MYSTDEQFDAGAVVLERVHLIHSYATPVPVRLLVEKKGTPLEVILLVNIQASQDVVNRPMMVLNPQVRGLSVDTSSAISAKWMPRRNLSIDTQPQLKNHMKL